VSLRGQLGSLLPHVVASSGHRCLSGLQCIRELPDELTQHQPDLLVAERIRQEVTQGMRLVASDLDVVNGTPVGVLDHRLDNRNLL